MSRAFPRGPAKIGFNLTPMIDVTFLLMMFFLLVAQPEVGPGPEEIKLPDPVRGASSEPTGTQRIVIDVMPRTGRKSEVEEYRVAGVSFGTDPPGTGDLTAAIAREVRLNPGAKIDVRADRDTDYAFVWPVIAALRESGAGAVNLYVEGEDEAEIER